ncbi:uncharacterized protein [Leptinotarsa decemlineata]|uniref:uncharacterized protein n=1 Tax=Leptinotarsa decemlineata TaxID=7539 RepID=UPI003D30C2C7
MRMYEKEFRNVFRLLNFVGMHPMKKLVTPLVIMNSLLTFYLTVLIVLKLFLGKELVAVESFGVFSQIWLKFFILTTKREKIKQVINDTQLFWKKDPENSQNQQQLKYLAKFERIFLSYIGCSTCMFLFKPLLVEGTTIYYYYRIPQIPFSVSYAIEFYVTLVTMSMVIAVNLFIAIVIVLGAGQFSNLNANIRQLDCSKAEENEEAMKICILEINENVIYHQFLIRYVRRLDDIFSMMFVVLIGIITALLCMNMYVLSLPHTTVVDMIRCGTMVCAFNIEFLLLYGVPAQRLMDEAEEVANSAFYHCEWYLPNIIPARKALTYMIHRSQTSVCLSAMGFIDINRQTIVAMLKTAYSFFTFLQTVQPSDGSNK